MIVRRLGRVAAIVSTLLAPSLAQAAERVAAPGGTPAAACTAAAPCDLLTAIHNAASGDDVLIEPGDYGSAAAPLQSSIQATASNLTVHGPEGGPRPKIFLSVAPSTADTPSGLILGAGSTLRNVEVRNISAAAGADAVFVADGATIDHVVASTGGVTTFSPSKIAAAIIVSGPATVVDTIAYATNNGGGGASVTQAGGEALRVQGDGGADTVRNTTAIAASGGTNFALDARGLSGATTVTLQNTIVEGSNGLAISASSGLPGTTMSVNGDHDVISAATPLSGAASVYNPDPATVTSQAAAFVNAATNDYHEAATSMATIDRGAPVPAGDPATDIDGDLRAVGSAPDIGADELPSAPGAAVAGASDVGTDHATVLGSVTAGGGVSSAILEYGPTSAFGSQTAATAVPAGASQQLISFPLTGLTPGTTYHARITISNEAGTVSSSEVTFTTTSPPPVDVPPTITKSGSSTTAGRSGKTFVVTLPLSVSCPAGEHCTATVRMTVPAATFALADASAARRKPIVIGSAHFSLQPGQRLRPRIKLNRTGARLLRRHRRVHAAFVVNAVAGATTSSTTGSVLIRRPHHLAMSRDSTT